MVVAALALAWATVLFGIAFFLALPLLLAFVKLLASQRRWWLLSALVGLSPITIAAAIGAASYFCGSARLLVSGLPSLELYNVDPETRFQTVSTGCIVNGAEPVWQIPNNVTLRVMRSLLGPMPGAYDGPFPSRRDAEDTLANAVHVQWDDLKTDSVPLPTRRIRLRPGLGSRFADVLAASSPAQPRAALWRERVLVLQLPLLCDVECQGTAMLAMIDTASGKVIAYVGAPRSSVPAFPRQWT